MNARAQRVLLTAPLGIFLVISVAGREHAFVRKRSSDLGDGLGEALIWEPADERPHAVMVCSHGIQSYARWFEPLGERLATLGVAVWAFNRPASGLGPQQQRPLHVNRWK